MEFDAIEEKWIAWFFFGKEMTQYNTRKNRYLFEYNWWYNIVKTTGTSTVKSHPRPSKGVLSTNDYVNINPI